MATASTSPAEGLHDRANTALHSMRHPGSQMHQRGVSLATVMDLGGRHFGPNASEKDHDALSFPTDKYDTFISHSHRTGRFAKYAALLYYTSLVPAVCAGLAAAILAFALTVYGILPPFGLIEGYETAAIPEPFPGFLWCKVMGGCTSFVVLAMWARLLDLAQSTRGTKVSYFFDRLCINQGDAELKQAGIDSIGAYLQNSDSMLVLWSPEYFTRLWCCFELAVFLEKSTDAKFKSLLENSCAEMGQASVGTMLDFRRNSSPTEIDNGETVPVATSEQRTGNQTHDRKLMIIPVQMGVFCTISLVILYLVLILGRVMEFLDRDLVDWFWLLAFFGGAMAICRVCRRYSQDRLELNKQIAQFTVSQADCNFPQDREFIKIVITYLYSETLTEIDGIAAFEYVLRSRVQQNVDEILGSRLRAPWRLTMACMFLQTLHGLDSVAETLIHQYTEDAPHLADSRALAERTARQAAKSFALVCLVHAFLSLAIVTSCLLPKRKSKLAEVASNAVFVFVCLAFMFVCVLRVNGPIYYMPALVSVPLNLTFGLLLLSGPACCNYVACWFSLRMPGGLSSNQEAGQEASQEANQETGEHESREETHREEGDCEHVLELREPQGTTSMNIMAPRPKADEFLLTTTQEAMILGNATVNQRPLPASHPSPPPLSLSCYCCEQVLVDSRTASAILHIS
ncbi:unnamed protein product [Polarella glacialis]|uniref:Uncharacterized protein n=1 Tax=Polarella glacialis TaxID=89957 RepID=A0A813FLY3_POLGL|nr:unnamed protein product [Polarella glacialis]